MIPKAVSDYLASHRQEHLKKLLELLAIPSVANRNERPGQADACQQAAQWLADHLRGLGLAARVAPTAGRPCVLASARVSDNSPTLLIYGHYDVQPPDPLELWHSPPFEPVVRDGCIYARGAVDDKGQLFAHLMALEAWQRAGGGLPLNVTMLLEGEEEIGSPSMESFLAEHRGELAADAIVLSDSEFFAPGIPAITYALRGIAYGEVTLTGPSRDLHSGLHGGAVANPVNALARLIARMHDEQGRVQLGGFYDDVRELTEAERRQWAELPFDEAEYAASLGLTELAGGEKGYTVMERLWGRPTLDCNGIYGGYSGQGSKTVIPSSATAKVTMRLVPRQEPDKTSQAFRRFVAENTPPGMRSSVHFSAGARPVMLKTDSPAMEAARAACEQAFGRPPAFIRCGASVPITEQFQRLLGLDAVLMGFGLPGDNPHSPNEKFALQQLYGGSLASAAFLAELAARLGR